MRGAIYGLIFGLLPGFHIDNAAHIGGLVAGFGVAYLAGTPGLQYLTEKLWRFAGWSCIVMTVVSFLKMYLWFTQHTQ